MRGKLYTTVIKTIALVVYMFVVAGISRSYCQQVGEVPGDSTFVAAADSVSVDSLAMADTLLTQKVPLWLGPHELTAGELYSIEPRIKDSTATFITIWLFIVVLMIGLLKFLFPMRFIEVIRASWEARSFTQLEREGGLITNWVSFFLFLNFLLSLSMLFYQSVTYLNFSHLMPSTHAMVILIYGLILFGIYYFLKFVVMLFSGWVFKTGRPTETVLRTSLILNQFTGVAMLPFLVVNYYNSSIWILAGAWVILLAMGMYKIIRLAVIGLKMPGFTAYHLILYLCTIEIAPLLFIIKYTGAYVSG